MHVVRPLPEHPFHREQVIPKGGRCKPRRTRAVHKVRPRRRSEYSIVRTLLGNCHLFHDLVGGEKVIGIEPLDVIALAVREGGVSRRGAPLVSLAHDANMLGLIATCQCESTVVRSVVDNDNLLARPRLGQRRFNGVHNPLLGVIGGNEDRHEWLHELVVGESVLIRGGDDGLPVVGAETQPRTSGGGHRLSAFRPTVNPSTS